MLIGSLMSKVLLNRILSREVFLILHCYSFMQDDQRPQCIIRQPPNTSPVSVEINYLNVNETEHLLDQQEELVGAPLQIEFQSKVSPPSLEPEVENRFV